MALASRAVLRTARQPTAWLPGIVLPLIVAAVFTADYGRAAEVIGFPASASYLRYVLPATVLAGTIYAGIVAGTEITTDLENGFISRLLLAPTWRPAIVAAPLTAAAVQGSAQTCVILAVSAAFGVGLHSVLGGVVVLAAAALLAAGVGALAVALGLLVGDSEVMQSLFGVLFILLFISSAFFPPADMRGWFADVAAHSPVSVLSDGLRAQFLRGTGGHPAVDALAVAAALCVIGTFLALAALRTRSRAGAA